jgi:hypothetical protein
MYLLCVCTKYNQVTTAFLFWTASKLQLSSLHLLLHDVIAATAAKCDVIAAIRVKIGPLHPHACSKRRINGRCFG